MQDPFHQEEVCKLTKSMVNSPLFLNLVDHMMPQVITILKSSGKAPEVHPQHSAKVLNPVESSVEERKQEKQDNKELLQNFRKDMEKMDFATSDNTIKQTATRCDDVEEEEEDDSFVIIDSPMRSRESPRKSITDILAELGFHDTKRNMKLVEKYEGNIDKILDELAS